MAMACKYADCKSENHRIQTPGLFSTTHYCLDCKRTFEVVTSKVKWGLVALGAAIGIDLSSQNSA